MILSKCVTVPLLTHEYFTKNVINNRIVEPATNLPNLLTLVFVAIVVVY